MNMKYEKEYIKIGLNILHYRRENHLTQDALSEMIGLSRQQFQRIETAHSAPSVDVLLSLSEVLGVPAHKFLEFRD